MKELQRVRILHRDVSKAQGTLDDFLRCYAKLRARAESMGQTGPAESLNRTVIGLRDAIDESNSALARLDGFYRVQIFFNRTARKLGYRT